jgi:hypothetical protein
LKFITTRKGFSEIEYKDSIQFEFDNLGIPFGIEGILGKE